MIKNHTFKWPMVQTKTPSSFQPVCRLLEYRVKSYLFWAVVVLVTKVPFLCAYNAKFGDSNAPWYTLQTRGKHAQLTQKLKVQPQNIHFPRAIIRKRACLWPHHVSLQISETESGYSGECCCPTNNKTQRTLNKSSFSSKLMKLRAPVTAVVYV